MGLCCSCRLLGEYLEIRALLSGAYFPLECANQPRALKIIVRDSLKNMKFDFLILLTF